jgi:formate dehydrogenase gamma subunit
MSIERRISGKRERELRLLNGVSAASLLILIGLAVGFTEASQRPTTGVCPPLVLKDEAGEVINPVKGINADRPYSPRQTCTGAGCHDYEKITEGYHFTQGAGEAATQEQKQRMAWPSSPGNFGGSWCSPAPLYRYLSPKQNNLAQTIDLTAFTFFTSPCGSCHPGGGPAEFDRTGNRYDHWMQDARNGLSPGADNGLDGDYYKSRWSETGVMEADCLLCHLPGYRYSERAGQIARWNFRWAATAGTGLAEVEGAVRDGKPVRVLYDQSYFDPEGKVKVQLVRSPRNEACLSCHAQPGWKKRGANFRARTDVHLRAGLRCVDCHVAGSSARDPRIAGWEVHQIGKGDDPGGLVRNDLDNTVLDCTDCHGSGRLGAPIALHRGLPAVHLERIACQTCHIPERFVMPAEIQAGDVYNDAPWVPGSKKLGTFYGPDGRFRNHYGFLEVAGYDDKPTEPFRPVLIRYKGRIFPANRVHSMWPGIEVEGESALMQPRMGDIVKMWTEHRANPDRFPALARITDDTGDGVPEVNRPEEIDALIDSVTLLLREIGYPMEGKRVVWVMNDRVYRSGKEFRQVEKADWEASPFANVHKYSHDIAPGRAALGANGCSDCHSSQSSFFFAPVLEYPFGEDGNALYTDQSRILGISRTAALSGAWRESRLKPAGAWLLGAVALLALIHLVIFGRHRAPDRQDEDEITRYSLRERLAHLAVMAPVLLLSVTGFCFLLGSADPLAAGARTVHAVAGFVFSGGLLFLILNWVREAGFRGYDRQWIGHLGGYFGAKGVLPAGKFNAGQKIFFWLVAAGGLGLAASGAAIYFSPRFLGPYGGLIFTLHDLLAIALMAGLLAHVYLALVINPGALRAILEGSVSKSWAGRYHPVWMERLSHETAQKPVGGDQAG